jgi:Tol biopolymer transport system component
MEEGANICWSPDGSQLAYTANRDNAWGLYTNNIEGTNERLFVSLGANRPITCRNWFIEPQATALPFQSWGQIKRTKK